MPNIGGIVTETQDEGLVQAVERCLNRRAVKGTSGTGPEVVLAMQAIERIIGRLEVRIAEEQKAMQTLLSRLRINNASLCRNFC